MLPLVDRRTGSWDLRWFVLALGWLGIVYLTVSALAQIGGVAWAWYLVQLVLS